jgi:AcrR family transcriptional regulator
MSVPPGDRSVKRRRYDASRRRDAAGLQREAVLDAAWNRFAAEGFVVTTVDTIASDAEVSTATIYKTFGGKAGIVRALVTRALRGNPALGIAAERRSDALHDLVSDGQP